jgi:hypothetical protein
MTPVCAYKRCHTALEDGVWWESMPTSTCLTCHLHGLYISNFTVVVLAGMLDLLSGNGCMTEYSGRHRSWRYRTLCGGVYRLFRAPGVCLFEFLLAWTDRGIHLLHLLNLYTVYTRTHTHTRKHTMSELAKCSEAWRLFYIDSCLSACANLIRILVEIICV